LFQQAAQSLAKFVEIILPHRIAPLSIQAVYEEEGSPYLLSD
jgi:hypothetical protein